MNNDIAIITARGGSKRIPGKNLRAFLGKPIIRYSIDTALSVGLFSEVIVSTDSLEIADYARSVGASVPFMRSDENSNDYATTSEVLVEVVEMLKKHGRSFDNFCCIYPTAPFITDALLKQAKTRLVNCSADSVLPIVRFAFPPQRALLSNDGVVEYQFSAFSQKRSQDLSPIYHDCGQFYYCRTASFEKYENTVMPNSIGIEISNLLCQDIDNEEDWQIAEMKYQLALAKGVLS